MPEQAWLETFLDARSDTLRHPHDAATHTVWADSAGRAAALRDLMEADEHQLDPPLHVDVSGDEHELR
ncbi:hypothetical protein GCM10007977_055490 [Dactylosporangium sucinum]|uniref:Uncharacterized protein n=1 Tax=Dactylosporangium sucinum TaxID=1424081 RepID=A0A917X077_9ACTN|nr:hypothetical protein GCM10007977_055490 [Dactylosporangium sucinum]